MNALSRHKHLMAMKKNHFDLLDQVKEFQNHDSYYLKIGDKLEKYDPSIKYFGINYGF